MSLSGRIESVFLAVDGSSVTADTASGSTVIPVGFPVDFDENGGSFTRTPYDGTTDTTVYAYTAVDVEGETVTAATALATDFASGDMLLIEPPSTDARALVRLSDSEDEPAVECRVSHALRPLLPLGSRDPGTGESVVVDSVDDSWVVSDLVGSDPAIVSADFIITDSAGNLVAKITAANDFDTAGNTFLAIQGPVGFTQPFQVLDPNALTLEAWHNLGSLGVTGIGFTFHRFRLTPDGEVEFDFAGAATGTVTGSSADFPNALPSDYRPSVDREYPVGFGSTGAGRAKITASTGVVRLTWPGLTSGDVIGGGFHMPRD